MINISNINRKKKFHSSTIWLGLFMCMCVYRSVEVEFYCPNLFQIQSINISCEMVIVRSNDVFDAICKLRCVLKKRKKGALKLHFERFSLEKMHLCLSVFFFCLSI